jgi:hypothetical protein
MGMSNAYCKKHDEIEPQNWDFNNDGLWICPDCTHKAKPIVVTKEIETLLRELNSKFKDRSKRDLSLQERR